MPLIAALQSSGKVTLPQNLQRSPGTLYEDFENAADWVPTNATLTNDATNFRTGTQGVKMTVNPAGSSPRMTKTVNWDLSGNWDLMVVWFRVNSPATQFSGSFIVNLANDAGVTQIMRHYHGYVSADTVGWHTMVCHKSDFAAVGGGTFANPIVRVQFYVNGIVAGQTPSWTMDSMYFDAKCVPTVMLRFDDGYLSTYTKAFAYMKENHVVGTLAALTTFVGSGGNLTWEQAREMDAAGWAIGNHTNAGTDLTTLTEAQQEAQILGGKNDLIAQGLSRCANYVTYPGGNSDQNTNTAMENLGMLMGQTAFPAIGDSADQLALPRGQLLHNTGTSITDATPLATATGYIDRAISKGYVMQLYFHDVGGAGQMTEADFRALIAYIVSKKTQIFPITHADFYNLTLGATKVVRML